MRRREREGREIPAAFLDPPEIEFGSAWYWEAWSTLSGDRALGMGEGPIPFSAIDRFARRHGIEEADDFDRLVAVIQAVDRVYLARRDGKNDDGMRDVVPVSDAAGVKSLLGRLAKAAG